MHAPRPVTAADLPGVFAIYDHEVLHGVATCDTEPPDEGQRRAWLAAHDGGDQPAFVIDDGAGVAAWGCLSAWSPRRAYARTCEDTVYVRADAQGRGLGRSMLERLIAAARERERGLIVARIVEGNPASRVLHERLGFETIGVMREVAEKFGRLLDVRLMGLRL